MPWFKREFLDFLLHPEDDGRLEEGWLGHSKWGWLWGGRVQWCGGWFEEYKL